MRTTFRSVICLLLSALIAPGCSRLDNRYLMEGVGTDLPYVDQAEATRLQDLYIGEICHQAGLPVVLSAPDTYQCTSMSMSSREWNMFVLAGMNDIDRRCNAYLQWLYRTKRGSEAIVKEIGDISAITQSILRMTGVGATPITLVGLGLGLGVDTFTNVKSTLIMEVNHSTVQSVVISARDRYVQQLKGLEFNNQPAAIHVLQNYLQICVPYTIETEINTTVTGVELEGPASLLNRPPLIRPAISGQSPLTPRTEVGPIIRHDVATNSDYKFLISDYSPTLDTIADFRPRLLKICATPDQADNVTANIAALKSLIKVYQFERRNNEDLKAATGLLTRDEVRKIGEIRSVCDTTKYANFYELTNLKQGITAKSNVNRLNKVLPREMQLNDNPTVKEVRQAVVFLRTMTFKDKMLFDPGDADDQFTSDFVRLLIPSPTLPTTNSTPGTTGSPAAPGNSATPANSTSTTPTSRTPAPAQPK